MLRYSVFRALGASSRAFKPLISSNASSACSLELLKRDFGVSVSNVVARRNLWSNSANGASLPEQQTGHVSSEIGTLKSVQSSSGVDYLYEAIGLTSERDLVARLARLWGLSPRVLDSTTTALKDLLQPCGRDSIPHALWMLVRCPSLRFWSEQQLRCSFRHLQQLTRGAQLTDHDFTAAVYSHPWMLNAAAATAVVRRTPTAPAAARAASTTAQQQQQQHPMPTSDVRQLFATLMVQAQAYSAQVSNSSSREWPPYVSPAVAQTAVKAYAATVEAARDVWSMFAALRAATAHAVQQISGTRELQMTAAAPPETAAVDRVGQQTDRSQTMYLCLRHASGHNRVIVIPAAAAAAASRAFSLLAWIKHNDASHKLDDEYHSSWLAWAQQQQLQ